MNFNCREANINDMKAVHDLIVELAIYEQEPNEVETTPEELVKLGFELEPPFFKCFVAELNNKIIGTAIVYNAFSTWKGKTVHLEDFIVNKNIRNKGVGSKLFDLVLRYSKKIGAKRLSLNALNWNENAINFYKKRGAKIINGWSIIHISEGDIN